MSHLFWLDLQRLKRIQHMFPNLHGATIEPTPSVFR